MARHTSGRCVTQRAQSEGLALIAINDEDDNYSNGTRREGETRVALLDGARCNRRSKARP